MFGYKDDIFFTNFRVSADTFVRRMSRRIIGMTFITSLDMFESPSEKRHELTIICQCAPTDILSLTCTLFFQTAT